MSSYNLTTPMALGEINTVPNSGNLTYKPRTATEIPNADGFFSFTFYITSDIKLSDSAEKVKKIGIYCIGILLYCAIINISPLLENPNEEIQKIIKDLQIHSEQLYKAYSQGYAPEHTFPFFPMFKNIFQNWKVLVYTDLHTMNLLQNTPQEHPLYAYFQTMLNDPNIIFCLVNFPEHQETPNSTKINGYILRSLRFRAIFDFPTKFVFCRDADTYFPENMNKQYKLINQQGLNQNVTLDPYTILALYRFEEKYFNMYFSQNPVKLVLTTGAFNSSHIYLADWHWNDLEVRRPPLGFLAGFVSIGPNVPCRFNPAIWNAFLVYLQERSHPITLNTPQSLEQKYSHQIEKILKARKNLIDNFENQYNNEKRFTPEQVAIQKKFLIDKVEKNKDRYNRTKKILIQSVLNSQKLEEIPFSNKQSFGFSLINMSNIGRDEQFLIFFLVPQCIDYVEIFYLNTMTLDNGIVLQKLDLDEMNAIFLKRFKEAMAKNFAYEENPYNIDNTIRKHMFKNFESLSYKVHSKQKEAFNKYLQTQKSLETKTNQNTKKNNNSKKGRKRKTRKH